jgi:predicted dehydrogenase
MSIRTFSTALVGLGNIAQFHASALRQMPGVQLVAGCDPNPRRREFACRHFGITNLYESVDDLLQTQQIDVCHVLAPPSQHVPLALKCLGYMCHCLLEKPLAVNNSEAQTLACKANEFKRSVGVNHNLIWNPAFRRLKSLIKDNHLGVLRNVMVRHSLNQSLQRGAWATQAFTNPIFEAAPHPLSLIVELLGPIQHLQVSICETIDCAGIRVASAWQANMLCERGPAACFVSLQNTYPLCVVSVTGEDGTAQVDVLGNTMTFSAKSHYREPLNLLFGSTRDSFSLIKQGLIEFSSCALGLFADRKFGGQFVRSMRDSLASFYQSLQNRDAIQTNFSCGVEVVRVCEMISDQLNVMAVR